MPTTPREALAHLAIEYWRLLRVCQRAIADQPIEKQTRGAAQLRYGQSRMEHLLQDHGLRLYTYDGTVYEPNLPVTVVNQEDVVGIEQLVVENTIEPTIMANGEVLAMGKVVLRKAEEANQCT